ncbi:hypothetical protein GA0070624_3967 [Micromonospora rhizosphaerae]|uniref:Uncharacterized protein n=1 Tax=Micromonospora rhizosphaerae TaxID=568872 RepID=A0A1C6SK27_9ACTN|nr:hypothetical protein [Micromonospora rhizosphaerae]SCL29874.1 hypothetical protein GA0070624_3967 [Micromonospora rhizosphaerae]
MASDGEEVQRETPPAPAAQPVSIQANRVPRNLSFSASTTVKALIASPIVILLATGTRLILIANYDTATATSIASANGAANTILGTVIPLLPAFFPLLFLALVLYRKALAALLTGVAMMLVSPAYSSFTAALHTGSRRFLVIVTAPAHYFDWVAENERHLRSFPAMWQALTDGVESPRDLLLVAADWRVQTLFYALGAVVLAHNAGRRWRHAREDRSFSWTGIKFRLLPLGMAFTALFVLAFVDQIYQPPSKPRVVAEILRQPWVPPEKLTLTNGAWRVGYTLSYKDGWHVLLEEESRTIIYIRATDVKSRTVCSVSTSLKGERPPLIRLGPPVPDGVPECPSRDNSSRPK